MESSRPPNTAWVLTQDSLDQLLTLLDPDRERAGKQYEIIRRKLLKFFEWRGAVHPDDLADETINRVARKLEAREVIRNAQAFVIGVARLVWLESLKQQERERIAMSQLSLAGEPLVVEEGDPRLECFDSCLAGLTAKSRDLIIAYHREERHAKIELRKELAVTLGIPLNALRIRAHRIRTQLEKCVADCLRESARG